jgi:hypothetical protein
MTPSASPVPPHLSALVKQVDAHLQPRAAIDAHLKPASIVAAAVYSLLLASGLIAHAMGFPRFSTEPRAKSFVSIHVPALLASEVETIGIDKNNDRPLSEQHRRAAVAGLPFSRT